MATERNERPISSTGNDLDPEKLHSETADPRSVIKGDVLDGMLTSFTELTL